MLRTKTCGELRKEHIGQEVTLCGWVHAVRDHGGVTFIDVRDKYGVTQVVSNNPDVANNLGREFVIQVKGDVRHRSEETYNDKIPTGEVELVVKDFAILNKSDVVPFEILDEAPIKEETRLKYRFLDLRRPVMQNNLRQRARAASAARRYLESQDFVEVETPMLVKSTPEGARDYVVPSRVHPGKFYALPQSPQLYKQILMVSGVDRYYQFARCLRDEDLRADRQPEFTQIDLEMSFVNQDDIFAVGEGMTQAMVKEVLGRDIEIPFPRFTYKESMERFGTDKPDLRFELEIQDVTDLVKESEFSVFNEVISAGGRIKLLNPRLELSRSELDNYISFVQSQGGKGMAWMRVTENGLDSNIVKYFPPPVQERLLKVAPSGTLLFIANQEKQALEVAGKLRLQIGKDKELIDNDKLCFAWTVDFPLFSWNPEANRWDPEHHMFTMPKDDCLQYLEDDNYHPEKVLANCYDFVLNGVELASGSIRISNPDIQRKVMQVVNYTQEEIEEKFSFLINAFKFGAPPHGGFAIGFDRLIALLLGHSDIREVIAFPKTKSAESLLDNSPTRVSDKQLKELKLRSDIVKKG